MEWAGRGRQIRWAGRPPGEGHLRSTGRTRGRLSCKVRGSGETSLEAEGEASAEDSERKQPGVAVAEADPGGRVGEVGRASSVRASQAAEGAWVSPKGAGKPQRGLSAGLTSSGL